MKTSAKLLAVFFLLIVKMQIFSQETEFFRRSNEYFIPEKIEGPVGNQLAAGTYSVGGNGFFPTLDSAFNKLSVDGIDGEVILELTDDLYTTTSEIYGFMLDGPIPGSGPNRRITIRPALNRNVTIEGNGEAVLNFRNVSYLIVDGIGLTGSTTLKIHSNENTNCPFNDGISFLNNSKHNAVQNVTIECDDYKRKGAGIVFFHESGNFMPDSNLIQNNFIKKSATGILVASLFYKATGNIIRGNIIGSETDSLISMGINLVLTQYSIVEDNIIQNIRNNSSQLPYSLGIASVSGTAEKIRNNVVHNVYVNDGNYGGMGILLNGTSSLKGCINTVYNNMVYNIRSTSSATSASVSGIQLRNQDFAKVYNNSVYLTGTGNNKFGSAALFIRNDCSNVTVNNNILVNNRDESPYCAASIVNYSTSNFESDYNDLYSETNQYNCLVKRASTDYHSLSEWQSTGNDLHSYVEMPHFIEPTLHIDSSFDTNLESGGTAICGITDDFDHELRNITTPDIGADEFDGTAIINVTDGSANIPTEFVLNQNYPNPFNPTTKISWQSAVGSWQTLKVYDALGNEVATLVDEYKPAGSYEIELNATELASGVYFYRFEAGSASTGSPNGQAGMSFVETKKMVLQK